VAYAEGLIQDAIAAPTTDIDMSILHKVTGLPVATNPSDAVRFDQLPDLNGYLTETQANGLYMAENQTLSGIQTNRPQALNMNMYAIINCADPQEPQDVVTLQYFNTHSGPTGPSNEIVNSSGFTRVTANNNETISLRANNSEIISV
jgi:hypothetical protein